MGVPLLQKKKNEKPQIHISIIIIVSFNDSIHLFDLNHKKFFFHSVLICEWLWMNNEQKKNGFFDFPNIVIGQGDLCSFFFNFSTWNLFLSWYLLILNYNHIIFGTFEFYFYWIQMFFLLVNFNCHFYLCWPKIKCLYIFVNGWFFFWFFLHIMYDIYW